MKFEEALKLMREGKKITHPCFEKDIYFQSCKMAIKFSNTPLDVQPLSIAKMKGEFLHEDMSQHGSLTLKEMFNDRCKHGTYPQLNLLLCKKCGKVTG